MAAFVWPVAVSAVIGLGVGGYPDLVCGVQCADLLGRIGNRQTGMGKGRFAKEEDMARRTNGALGEIISTIVNVLTLPFRVLGRLLSGGRKRKA